MAPKVAKRIAPPENMEKNRQALMNKIIANLSDDSGTLKFLTRMASIGIATYLHQRKFIPESILQRRRITDEIAIYTFNKKTRWGLKLLDMMTGIGEAISMKYAREVIVMVNEDAERKDCATEVFTLTFAYNEKDCLHMTDETGNVIASLGYSDKQTFSEQVTSILLKISAVIKKLEPIDMAKATPHLKLTYYDRTPPDYEPFAFRRCERAYYFENGKPPQYVFGSISTNFAVTSAHLQSIYIKDLPELHEDDSRLNESIMRMHEPLNTTIFGSDGDGFNQASPGSPNPSPSPEQPRAPSPDAEHMEDDRPEPDERIERDAEAPSRSVVSTSSASGPNEDTSSQGVAAAKKSTSQGRMTRSKTKAAADEEQLKTKAADEDRLKKAAAADDEQLKRKKAVRDGGGTKRKASASSRKLHELDAKKTRNTTPPVTDYKTSGTARTLMQSPPGSIIDA